jgi:phosphatidylinositol alpha-mannosyltransferase
MDNIPLCARTSEPLHICHVVPYDLAVEAGGIKRHVQHLADAQRGLGDRVTIIGPSSGPLEDPHMHGFGGVVSIQGNGGNNLLGLLVSPRKLRQFFGLHGFDVLHLHEPQTPLLPYWATWMARKLPKVATFHAYSEGDTALRARKLVGALLSPWIQRGIAVSNSAARYAQPAWNQALRVIPNGVDTAVFTPARRQAAPSVGTAQRPLKLLFVGQISDARKGARYMLEAYRRLRAQQVEVTLDLVGDVGSFAPLPKMPGLTVWNALSLADLAARYRETDIFVAPSTGQESFGMVLLEAMASAKPVVCSAISGYCDVINPAGASVVPPADAEALAAALRRLVEAPQAVRDAMGAANLRCAQTYDWNKLVHLIRTEYAAALQTTPSLQPAAQAAPC